MDTFSTVIPTITYHKSVWTLASLYSLNSYLFGHQVDSMAIVGIVVEKVPIFGWQMQDFFHFFRQEIRKLCAPDTVIQPLAKQPNFAR